jgi:hypothetical protein
MSALGFRSIHFAEGLDSPRLRASDHKAWTWAATALAIGAFFYFAHYRVRYIGGCDASAYLMESWRLRGLDVGLARDPSVPYPRALVPLCMVEHAGVVRSFFPPGFSLLLAGAGLFGAEFYVTPFAGALSGLLLFFVARARAGSPLALSAMIAWLVAPLALWGSTQMMSDLPATTLLLAALFAADQKRTLVAGVLIGLAAGIRHETVLFIPALIMLLPRGANVLAIKGRRGNGTGNVLHLAFGLALAGSGWLIFLFASFGSLHLPYASNLAELTGQNFARQATFLIGETARQHAPVAVFAMVASMRKPRECSPYVLWFASFVFLHALWRVPYDAWWHARFVLPGLPALFVLAAIGASTLRDSIGASVLRYAITGTVLAAYIAFCITFAPANIHRTRDWDEHYARDARRIAALLPKEALVGTSNYSAPLRYYERVETFSWCQVDAPALIRWALDIGRPVYAILEGPAPVERCDGLYDSVLSKLDFIPALEMAPERRLVEIRWSPSFRPSAEQLDSK